MNYILGVIVIEIGELLIPMYYEPTEQKDFVDNMILVIDKDNDFLSSRYTDVWQTKRVLNGIAFAFVLLGIGVFLEGLPLCFGYMIIGTIGLAGSLVLAVICPFISVRVQKNFYQTTLLSR